MGQACCCCCCFCIDQASVGLVEEWGRFLYVAQPGLHFVNPLSGRWLAGTLSTRLQYLDVRAETKTRDNVFVQLLCSIQYRILRHNADDAFYELQNPREQIQAYVFDVVRACVPKLSLDDLFEQKSEVAKAVSEELEKTMGSYGYSIEQTLIVDIILDAAVRRARNEINAAQRSRVASEFKAESEKALQVKRAEAEAESKYLAGVGIARQRQAITEGLRESIATLANGVSGISTKDIIDMVMLTHYFDTIKDTGSPSRNTIVFLPHGPGHVSNVAEQVRNGLLQANNSSE